MPSGIYLTQENSTEKLAVEFAPFVLPHVDEAEDICSYTETPITTCAIVPAPAEVGLGSQRLTLPESLTLKATPGLAKEIQLFDSQLQKHRIAEGNANEANIVLTSQALLSEEEYHISVSDKVELYASSSKGFSYGLTSLAQLLNHSDSLACGEIKDKPRFQWRGFMLDCVRHFRNIDKIKQLIDMMAYYKLNYLHWHFTDDEAWRLEIKAFPELTEKTAWRGHDMVIESQFGTGAEPYGGFYSQDEVRDIVAYAASRHIEVVPEIDIPGHCRAAVKALPELLVDPDDTSEYCSVQFYNDNVLNPALPGTYEFIDKVLEEVTELFPSAYVHVGADEVPHGVWEKSAKCQQMMQEQGYQDLRELQGHLLRYAQDKLRKKGKTLLGWEEAIDGDKLEKDAIICAWTGIDNGIKAANNGYNVVMTPAQYTYLDMAYTEAENEPGATWAATITLEKIYRYEPLNDALTESGKAHIVGVQSALWCEFVRTDTQVDYMVFPRLLAAAETCWSQPANKSWDSFKRRLPAHYRHLEYRGIKYRKC